MLNARVAELLLPLRFLFTAGITWLLVLIAMSAARTLRGRLIARNFRADVVPVVGGIVLLVVAGIFISPIFGYSDVSWESAVGCAQGIIFFAVLGLIDDWLGDRSTGGFQGHFQKLVNHRQMTTGLIKAVGGLLAALYIGRDLFPTNLSGVILSGLLIALAANTLNLFDLRPGRASAFALVLLIILMIGVIIAARFDVEFTAIIVLAAALVLYLFDRNALIMLGDAGSNALGAAVGVLYAAVLPLEATAVVVIVLIAFQIWCERHSLNRLIMATPWLRRIDAKVGVREQTPRPNI